MKTLTATALVSAASAAVTSLLFIGIVSVATIHQVEASPTQTHTVVIQHARMTPEEVQAYDLEMSQSIASQVVEIHAKRLTSEEKANFVV